jgi:hypothetical protein
MDVDSARNWSFCVTHLRELGIYAEVTPGDLAYSIIATMLHASPRNYSHAN